MFYCPNCNNAFDIARTTGQQGGKIKNFNDFLASESTESTESIDVMRNNQDTELLNSDLVNSSLEGGKPSTLDENSIIIKKIFDNEFTQADAKNLSKDFFKSTAFKNLDNDSKQFVYNKIQDLLPKDKKKIFAELEKLQKDDQKDTAFFVCKNCGFAKKIKPNTLIFSRSSDNVSRSNSIIDYSDMVHNNTLPITRKYLCPNDKCISHKNPEKKEAVFFRINNTYEVRYICKLCNTQF